MKNKEFITILLLISLFAITSAAIADGLAPVQNQQSYPVPQLYPIGQAPAPNYNPQPYNYQPQPQQYNYQTQPQQYNYQQPYYYPYQPQYQPQPQYYYSPQYYNNTQPIYDPNSGLNFYPITGQPQYFYPTQQAYPYGNDRNVIVAKNWKSNGSVDLTWTIRNTTNEDWGRSNVDIKCISGCHLLTDPNRTLWDIPHTVNRNNQLTFTVNIWQPMYGETMTFAMVAGSKTLYTFNVNPN